MIAVMAPVRALSERIRELLVAEAAVRERGMFGGVAFLVGGSLAITASARGGVLVRVDPGDCEQLLRPGVEVAVMHGRPLRGWLRVAEEEVASQRELALWVERGTACARSLPARPGG